MYGDGDGNSYCGKMTSCNLKSVSGAVTGNVNIFLSLWDSNIMQGKFILST